MFHDIMKGQFFLLIQNRSSIFDFKIVKMPFYDLPKEERGELVQKIHNEILAEIRSGKKNKTEMYFSDEDTYIRKAGYLAVGRIYISESALREKLVLLLDAMMGSGNAKIRQTVVNSAGEIGMHDFTTVERFFHQGLFDEHHSVRNAVIGSLKKIGEKNPKPMLAFAKHYLHHEDKEVRREICHGLELRGRTHPEDILPLLKELEFDKTARVRNTLVHVLGQIAYKKGCLEKVIAHLKMWENTEVVKEAIDEILDVHIRYKNFSCKTHSEAKKYVDANF